MTFENLKQKCVQEFCYKATRINGNVSGCPLTAIAQLVELRNTGKFKNPRVLMKEIEDECVLAIERTDIRNVKALIELCPDSFPKWIKNGNYTIDLTDKGWEFLPN